MNKYLQFILMPLLYAAALLDQVHARGLRFGEGPGNVKELHEAMEKAFKVMQDNIKKTQDNVDLAIEQVRKEGTIYGETNKKLGEIGEEGRKLADSFKELRQQVLDVEQKMAKKIDQGDPRRMKSAAEIVAESDEYKACQKQGSTARHMDPVNIGSFHKTQIVNATGYQQPLVPPMIVPGIITPAQQRMTVRQLMPSATTTSNLIEYASEATFTSNARPQGDLSPGGIEGEIKAESAMTFTLTSTPVVTIAHWIPASRQVLSDAPMLQGHIGSRLMYGLVLEEEHEFLTGNGTAGTINGLVNQATAFTGGVTNATALDTILKAMLQVSLSFYEASGIVLNPIDWVNIMLLKDTQGRYLFTNPQDMVAARLWAKPVVPTVSMTLGKFLVGAFDLAAQIWDREDATIRISENVNDHFIRNMVAILCEERTALAVYRPTALIYGNVSNAG